MTAYMKPQERGIYQEQEAQILGSQTSGLGKRAVLQADPRLMQLHAGQAAGQMDRKLMYGRLGMQKEKMEHDIKMGEGGLELAKKGQRLSEKAFRFDLKQQSKATNIAKFGMAMNLAFGMGGFMQNLKNQRKTDFLIELQIANAKAIARERRAQQEAIDNA